MAYFYAHESKIRQECICFLTSPKGKGGGGGWKNIKGHTMAISPTSASRC